MAVEGHDLTASQLTRAIYRALARAIFLVVGIVAVWSFFDAITLVILSFVLAAIIAIALTPPVNWLEKRRVARPLGAMLVLLTVIGTFVGLGFVVAPIMSTELDQLSQQFPEYRRQIMERFDTLLANYPQLREQVTDERFVQQLTPSAETVVRSVGRYSISLLTLLGGALVLFALVLYMLISPRPLLRGILQAVPADRRKPFVEAMTHGSHTVGRWVWANMIIGAIEAVAAGLFLSWLGIPGAWLWGLVTFFAELIPQLGSYAMAIPPAIVALAIDPSKALWVILFYIVLQQFVNNALAPMIRSRTMKVHPVSEIFAVVALTFMFGIIGAIISDPLLGFAKAFYDAFYGKKQEADSLDGQVETILQQRVAEV